MCPEVCGACPREGVTSRAPAGRPDRSDGTKRPTRIPAGLETGARAFGKSPRAGGRRLSHTLLKHAGRQSPASRTPLRPPGGNAVALRPLLQPHPFVIPDTRLRGRRLLPREGGAQIRAPYTQDQPESRRDPFRSLDSNRDYGSRTYARLKAGHPSGMTITSSCSGEREPMPRTSNFPGRSPGTHRRCRILIR